MGAMPKKGARATMKGARLGNPPPTEERRRLVGAISTGRDQVGQGPPPKPPPLSSTHIDTARAPGLRRGQPYPLSPWSVGEEKGNVSGGEGERRWACVVCARASSFIEEMCMVCVGVATSCTPTQWIIVPLLSFPCPLAHTSLLLLLLTRDCHIHGGSGKGLGTSSPPVPMPPAVCALSPLFSPRSLADPF